VNSIAVNKNNKTAPRTSLIKILVLVCLSSLTSLNLTGCGGRNVITQDDSADYKSARALPPLKKRAAVTYSAPAPVQEPAPITTQTVEPIITPSDTAAVETQDLVDESNVIESETTEQRDDVLGQTVQPTVDPITEPSPEALVASVEPTPEVGTTPVSTAALSNDASQPQTELISPQSNVSRLRVDADANPAWQYLVAKLAESDLTVHARNKKAGRFSIGCNGIETGQGVIKSGGWSIFTRKSEKISDYCSLLTTTSRGTTTVKVVDRSGVEASAESASAIFARLLKE